jgi:hypothetical protein
VEALTRLDALKPRRKTVKALATALLVAAALWACGFFAFTPHAALAHRLALPDAQRGGGALFFEEALQVDFSVDYREFVGRPISFSGSVSGAGNASPVNLSVIIYGLNYSYNFTLLTPPVFNTTVTLPPEALAGAYVLRVEARAGDKTGFAEREFYYHEGELAVEAMFSKQSNTSEEDAVIGSVSFSQQKIGFAGVNTTITGPEEGLYSTATDENGLFEQRFFASKPGEYEALIEAWKADYYGALRLPLVISANELPTPLPCPPPSPTPEGVTPEPSTPEPTPEPSVEPLLTPLPSIEPEAAETNASVTLEQGDARVGEPVAWRKKVFFLNAGGGSELHMPWEAENITVFEVAEDGTKQKIEGVAAILSEAQVAGAAPNETNETIEANATSEASGGGQVAAPTTAPEAATESSWKQLVLPGAVKQAEVDYFTPAPTQSERVVSSDSKEIVLSSKTHYVNVYATATLPMEVPSADLIRLVWKITAGQDLSDLGLTDEELRVIGENGFIDKPLAFNASDSDGDGLLDRVEWFAPSLSEQFFELGVESGGWHMILFYNGAGNAPTGWTCISCNSGDDFYNLYPRGLDTYGVTGGTDAHTHTCNTLMSGPDNTVLGDTGFDDWGSSDTHTHTITQNSCDTAQNDPLYYTLKMIRSNLGGTPATLPEGSIGVFGSTSLPTGWTRLAGADYDIIKGSGTSGTQSGAATHTHQCSVDWMAGTLDYYITNAGTGVIVAITTSQHSHSGPSGNSVSQTSDEAENSLPNYKVVLGRLNSDQAVPNGLVAMWDATPETGWSVVSSAGQDLNDMFLNGSTSYAVETSSLETHTHTLASADTPDYTGGGVMDPQTSNRGISSGYAAVPHHHTVTWSDCSETDTVPPYRSVIFANYTGGVTCGTLGNESTYYSLTDDVSSTGTCFTITAYNVTLDCQGHTVTFATATSGYGVKVAGQRNATVKNCAFTQSGSLQTDSYGVFVEASGGSCNATVIQNNSFASTGLEASQPCAGVYLNTSSNVTVYNNSFTPNANSHGIFLYRADNNENLSNNSITLNDAQALDGVRVYESSFNKIFNNSITVTQATNEYAGINFYFDSSGQWCHNNTVSFNNITVGASTYYGVKLSSVSPDSRRVENSSVFNNTITVNGATDSGIYSLQFVGSNRYHNNSITAAGLSSYGFNLAQESSSFVQDNNVTVTGDDSFGVYLSGASSLVVGNNTVSSQGGTGGSRGLWPFQVTNSNFSSNFVSLARSDAKCAFFQGASTTNNTFNNNSLACSGASSYGLSVNAGSNNTFGSNNISGGTGVDLLAADYNNFSNNTITASGTNAYAVQLTNADYCNFSNNTLRSAFIDFSADSASVGNTVGNTTFNSSLNKTTVSFTWNGAITANSSTSPAGDPGGYVNISKYLNVSNSSTAWVYLNVSYLDSDIPGGVSESSLRLWHYDGAAWSQVSGSAVDVNNNYVYANLTEFSVFAPMGSTGVAEVIDFSINCSTLNLGVFQSNSANASALQQCNATIYTDTNVATNVSINGSDFYNSSLATNLTVANVTYSNTTSSVSSCKTQLAYPTFFSGYCLKWGANRNYGDWVNIPAPTATAYAADITFFVSIPSYKSKAIYNGLVYVKVTKA